MGLLDFMKFLTQAAVNELVRKKTNGIFSSYEELKEWNELKKSFFQSFLIFASLLDFSQKIIGRKKWPFISVQSVELLLKVTLLPQESVVLTVHTFGTRSVTTEVLLQKLEQRPTSVENAGK